MATARVETLTSSNTTMATVKNRMVCPMLGIRRGGAAGISAASGGGTGGKGKISGSFHMVYCGFPFADLVRLTCTLHPALPRCRNVVPIAFRGRRRNGLQL